MNKKIYTFTEQAALSKVYEDKMLAYWRTLKEVSAISDLRELKKYRDMDIDFLHLRIHDDILKARTMELKVDFRMADTGNLFIEPEGWLSKTRAEVIAYLDAIRKLCYYIDTNKLRKYMDIHSDTLRETKVYTDDFGGYEVKGKLLPYTTMVTELNPYTEDLNKVL